VHQITLIEKALWLEQMRRPPYIAAVHKNLFARWRANFFTGLAVLLPAIASVVVVVWFFSSVANVTDYTAVFSAGRTHPQKRRARPDVLVLGASPPSSWPCC